MKVEQLVDKLRMSLPSKRILEAVNLGAVQIGKEMIILKKRDSYDFSDEDLITYSEIHDYNHNYNELNGKCVIFDWCVFGERGKVAIQEYLENK